MISIFVLYNALVFFMNTFVIIVDKLIMLNIISVSYVLFL